MKRISELSQVATKRQITVIKYPTGKFGFVGSGIPVSLCQNEDGRTRVFDTREAAEAAGKSAGVL